jgi:hypothetical protein
LKSFFRSEKFRIFAEFTAPFLNCAVPTLFRGRLVAA